MIQAIKSWFKKPPKEKHMQHFSHEYLEKLVAEHRLVSAAIIELSRPPGYPKKVKEYGLDVVDAALKNLKAKKVELETMIDVLSEYLNG